MNIGIFISSRGKIFDLTKACVGEVVFTSFSVGKASSLEFKVGRGFGESFEFFEGDCVKLIVDERVLFLGYIFSKERNSEHIISVCAYDQLRYLKNKDTYNYSYKSASDVVKMIATDFELKTGEIDNSGFVIASRIEESKTLFDIILNAVDLTYKNTGKYFILFDDAGKLCFKNRENLKQPFVLSPQDGGIIDFSCRTDIDSDTFTRVKLYQRNKKKQINKVFSISDDLGIEKFGVLQYFEKVPYEYNDFQVREYAKSVLESRSERKRVFSIKCFGFGNGEASLRGGNGIFIENLDIGDEIIFGTVFISKCVHTFRGNEHILDLTFEG